MREIGNKAYRMNQYPAPVGDVDRIAELDSRGDGLRAVNGTLQILPWQNIRIMINRHFTAKGLVARCRCCGSAEKMMERGLANRRLERYGDNPGRFRIQGSKDILGDDGFHRKTGI